jgi:lipopolysaccharide transport system ATP-binding protein
MSDVAIAADNLSKCYKIAHEHESVKHYRTLRDDLISLPRKLLGSFRSNGNSKPEAFWALKNVSFEVKKGEVIGIIGRNGAGKSTLFKILNRITQPTSGGADIYGRVGALLEVGTGFHPELTGRENVFMNGAILGMRRNEIRDKFDEIVSFAGVEKFLDTPVKRYSSGMYVRLAFAVAAHLEAQILLVDEVLAVGDAEYQNKCLGKMHDIAQAGKTVIFISHAMHAISTLCPRALWLHEGHLVADGPAAEVIADYTANPGGPSKAAGSTADAVPDFRAVAAR